MKTAAVAGALIAALVVNSIPAMAAEPLKFRLDWTIYGTHAFFFLALEEGLYAKQGLDVTLSEGQGGAVVTKLVAQNTDNLGFIDFATMLAGIEQGMPLKAVGGMMNSISVVITRPEDNIKKISDLEGKVVAVGPGESTAIFLRAALAANNVDPGKINMLSPAFGAKNALFMQRRADAIPGAINVQIAQIEAQGHKVSYFKFSDVGVAVMNNGIVANTNYLAAKPEAVKAFILATGQAVAIAKSDPDRAINAIIKRMPEQARNRDVLRRQLLLSFDAMSTPNNKDKPFGWMSEDDWAATQEVMVKYGGLSHKLDLSKVYTNDYVPQVK